MTAANGNGNGNGGGNLAHGRVTEIMLASPDGKALLERVDGATGECVGVDRDLHVRQIALVAMAVKGLA